MSKGDTSITYKYDDSGIRTEKKVNDKIIRYTTVDGRITSQDDGTNKLYFYYDEYDSLLGFEHNGTPNLYIRNIQGDIYGITDVNGTLLVQYEYDAWGQVESITGNQALGQINPMRYRGYYYDASVRRFINADVFEMIGNSDSYISYNLYAYCENNPINFKDLFGYGPKGTIIGALLGFGLGAILLPYVADILKLNGWGRKVFISLGVVSLTGLGSYIGYYVGEAIFTIYKSGGSLSYKVNKAIATGISKIIGGSLKAAQGNGWIIKMGKYTLRIMTSGGGRKNYFRLSHATKGALTILGQYSNQRDLTHIDITLNNIVKIINLLFKLK